MEDDVIIASKKRMFLAWYLDFILFMALTRIATYFLLPSKELPFWMAFIVFVVVEVAANKTLGSPGMHMLSINRNREVDPSIFHRQNWLSILIGVFLILEGTKQLVRWTQFVVPKPFFGYLPDPFLQIILSIISGLILVATGYMFLKLNRFGLWLGLATAAGTVVSCMLSWQLWDQVVVEIVEARRECQGIPVRENEIEMMQLLMPEAIIIVAVISMVAMLFTAKQFKERA
jgi:hypothetical protein